MIYELIGQSSYDPASPSRIYFSIGSAVMAVTLILAFNQLIRPITRFRLNTGRIEIKYIYRIIIIAIFSVFVAAILPFIPGNALPFLGYPFFWEFLAGLLLVFASLFFIQRTSKPVHFTQKNYKNYLNECAYIIACGQDRDLRELADEIYFSIKEIVSACKEYDSSSAYIARERCEEYKISERAEYALSLLDLLSDANFCRAMVCHVPRAATEIFHQIKEQGLYNSGGHSLVQQIVAQAFIDKNSILHREQDHYGLGHIKCFTNLVFGNYELIESGLNPLGGWSHWEEENLQPWKVKKYSKVLNVATEANITSNWRRGYPGCLGLGFESLTNIALSESIKLDKLSNDEAYDSLAYRNLKEIQRGLRGILDIAIKHEKNINDPKINEEKYEYFQDYSLYSVLAKAVYNYYENLSGAHSKDDNIRFLAIDIWLKIFPFGDESKAVKAIQKRLNLHFFDKMLGEDLIMLSHSLLIRLLINIVGISPSQPEAEREGAILFKKKLFDLLKNHYETFAKTEPERAKNMLPDKVRYDEKKGQLIQTYPSGSTSVLDLRE